MICYDEKTHIYTLHTAHTSYQLGVDDDGRLIHLHYGARCEVPLVLQTLHNDEGRWPNMTPQEWPTPGLGDNHYPFFALEWEDGSWAADLRFESAEMYNGKYALPGLPSFGVKENDQTLKVVLSDKQGLKVSLLYAVAEDSDLITRAARVENNGTQSITLRGIPSAVLDFPQKPMDFITFDGSWASERRPFRAPVRPGVQSVGSVGGIPTHAHNPAVVLCEENATENSGECWGVAFVYSGNFRLQVEQSASGIRLSAGIEPFGFEWILSPGETFVTPEVAFVYSACGLHNMSKCYHKAVRERLLRGHWSHMGIRHPVLLNSWEACYFDFTEEKLLQLAAAAKCAGADLFVLDDGWFRGRNSDRTSLGDWEADVNKLPNGVAGLCKKINDMGLEFGIWIEPEAISPVSNLFRLHPDWALQIPGRKTVEIRHQYTLDFSRADVREGIWQQLTTLLDSCPIRYLKWDMNRSLANVWSSTLPANRQGEVYHRYVLGLYEIQQRLIDRYPELLLENCAGGGARFDFGMLYYSPQIWCSDNTDALDRLTIQYGTSFFYPPCVMGAHYSTVPNHISGRTASVEARMAAALSGTFGFELDLTKYTSQEVQELRLFVDFYREHGVLLRTGDLYRLCPPDDMGAAWAIAAEDGSEAIVFASGRVLDGRNLRLPFAKRNTEYVAEQLFTGNAKQILHCNGTVLASYGLSLPVLQGDVPGYICYLQQDA